jgi:hypothetical protein
VLQRTNMSSVIGMKLERGLYCNEDWESETWKGKVELSEQFCATVWKD